jgi:hypothetical protein
VTLTADAPPILTQLLSERLPTQPYPGIRPFEEDEWPLFFGRQAIIEQLLERLSAARFVAVIGASGDGKSSLVKAGLFATLKHKHRRLGIRWQTVSMRPAGSPMWSLAEGLFTAIEQPEHQPGAPLPIDRIEPYRAALARGPHAIASILRAHGAPRGHNLLLLVDQFEELFRYDLAGGQAEIRTFLNQLADVVETPPDNFYLALTMRADFLGECARYPRFADLLNRASYLLRRMRPGELSEAIARPAELFGGRVDPGLLETLLRDAQGEQDQLPLLQHALMWLWTREIRSLRAAGTPDAAPVLELSDYASVGGVAGALSQHLNEIFDGLGGPEASPQRRGELQLATRRMFQALSRVADTGQVTRRPLRFAALAAETGVPGDDLATVINALRGEGRRFLMTSSTPIDDGSVIDVGHEAVIRCWDKLSGVQGWLREEQFDAETWDRLHRRTRAFIRNPGDLLSAEELTEFATFWERRRPSAAWTHRYGAQEPPPTGPADGTKATSIGESAEALLKASRRRRHLRLAAGLIIGLIVLLGLAGSVLSVVLYSSWAQERELRDKAEQARQQAEQARLSAEKAQREAEKERERALAGEREARNSAEDLQQALLALQKGEVNEARDLIETQRDRLVSIQSAAPPVATAADDISRYTLFLHTGGGPGGTADLVKGVLQKQGYTVRPDGDTDDSGGPGVDYFYDQDRAGAERVAGVVNSALPEDLKRLQPRRQQARNPPGYLGVWLFDPPVVVATSTWNAGPPDRGWCLQRDRRAFTESRAGNFLVNCYASQDDCRVMRRSDRGPRTPCVFVNNLGSAQWKPGRGSAPPGGRPASWFQYSPEPMGPPFPQLEASDGK